MLELASSTLDPSKLARGKDNFLVFAAELEIYRRAASSLHVCTVCPRGDADECTRAHIRKRARKIRECIYTYGLATGGEQWFFHRG